MPRIARVVVPGMPHHITQRGSRRSEVFRDEDDRLEYLGMFRKACREFLLRVIAYCLMTNHVHFVAIPGKTDSIRRVFHRVHGAHARHFNLRNDFVGHLWQERPFSCVLGPWHFVNAIRYVEQNPVRAGIVKRAADYKWSSAAAHCSGKPDPLLDVGAIESFGIQDWAAWLENRDMEANDFLRDCTATGRPCGNDAFVREIELSANRDFTRKKPGPKPKAEVKQIEIPLMEGL